MASAALGNYIQLCSTYTPRLSPAVLIVKVSPWRHGDARDFMALIEKVIIWNCLIITFSVAKRYVEKLVQAGILKELTGFARNRIYRAEEIYKALTQTGE